MYVVEKQFGAYRFTIGDFFFYLYQKKSANRWILFIEGVDMYLGFEVLEIS